jgi:hypothetical protein
MRKTAAAFALAVLVPALLLAGDAPQTVTITGEVVDTTCYLLHDGHGPEHADCAVTCVKAGAPAAILDDKTQELVYPLSAASEAHHHERPDAALLPLVGKRVRVTGRTVRRGGVCAIVVEKVVEAR